MTNYRIDRIGTHRHASALNLTTSTRQNRDRGYESTVSSTVSMRADAADAVISHTAGFELP